jgi:hypothetical protein
VTGQLLGFVAARIVVEDDAEAVPRGHADEETLVEQCRHDASLGWG